MYGIEYSTLANLIKYDDKKENNKFKNSRRNSTESFVSTTTTTTTGPTTLVHQQQQQSQSINNLTENLVAKLQNLKICPMYLMPKTDLNTSTTFTSSSSSVSPNLTSSKQLNNNYYTDDFILLTEFSEIEGPKPLLTIPTDGGTGFNKNEYSLHLMCVDFHSHVQLHNQQLEQQPQRNSTNKFNLTKDTSIINYWDCANSVAACVHHFNLYDLEARGFVRPFCLAYISYDRTKPVFYFEQIRTRFAEITDLLKKSNFNLFKFDLEQRCADLRFTRQIFIDWCEANNNEKRIELAKKHRMDAKTCARLTASTLNEKAKQLQLNAIDTLLKELEYVIEVISMELKLKQWNKKIRKKSENTDSISLNSDEKISIQNRDNRSFTYPGNDSNKQQSTANQPTINRIHSVNGGVKNNNSKKLISNHRDRSPILFKNILVGNLSALQNGNGDVVGESFEIGEGFSGGIDFQQLNQSSKLQQHKTMKRLHQLSSHTAKQAINEMRLMQLYFSTPYYLLKFRELATPVHNFNKNNVWSIMCGEIAIANFGTHIDTFNLNKNHLIRMANSNNNNNNNKRESSKLNINHKSLIHTNDNNNENEDEEENDEETLLYSSNNNNNNNNNNKIKYDSIKTQFYSPVNNELTRQWLNHQNQSTNDSSSDIEILTKQTSQLSQKSNQTVWETAIEQFLECSTENEEQEEDEEFHDNYDEETISNNDYLETKSTTNTEENEYDFVNSLMTSEYKPYNQYSTSESINNPTTSHLNMNPTASTLSLSSSFTSPAIIYSAFNRCKYQPNLTDKLIQIIEFNFEETLKQLLVQFHLIMPHLFYSLLKGRPVICVSRYCDDLPYLTAITDCLSNFLPNSFDSLNDFININTKQQPPKFTSSPNRLDSVTDLENNNSSSSSSNSSNKPQLKSIYERKPIKLNDLKYCKLFGLSLMISKDDSCCSADCNNNLNNNADTLSVNSSNSSSANKKRSNSFYKHNHKHYHQSKSSISQTNDDELLLKYIPITVRNYVSIFDLDKCCFIGPKYTGVHLKTTLAKAKQMQQDSIIYLYLLNNLVKHYVKIAFLYNYSIMFDDFNHEDNNSSLLMKSRTGSFNTTSHSTKRERIKRYFALYNNNNNNEINNDSKTVVSYYSSISSLASSLMGVSNSNISNSHTTMNNKQITKNNSDSDSELLKIVVALVDLTINSNKNSLLLENNNSNNNNNNSVKFEGLTSFDQTDFNIVNYILKSLQMKQMYLYDLAMKRKNLNNNTREANVEQTQFSLIVDFEELTVFNSNTSNSATTTKK